MKVSASKASDEEEKEKKEFAAALASIQTCYKNCFAAFGVEFIIAAIDIDIWTKISGNKVSWLDAIDIFDNLNLLIVGLGLRLMSKVYAKLIQSEQLVMEDDDVLDVTRTMARVWRTSAWSVLGISVSMAFSLREHAGLDINPSILPGAVFAIAAAGAIAIRLICASIVSSSVEADGTNTLKIGETFKKARKMGFLAYKNQAICAFAFGLNFCLELATWVLKKEGLIGRIFSVSAFLTPFAITRLLLTLNRRYLRVVIAATRSRSNETVDEGIFTDFFVAQTGFYTEIGSTIKSATIFRVLPYLIAPIQPYLLAAARLVAPSLVEKFGLE